MKTSTNNRVGHASPFAPRIVLIESCDAHGAMLPIGPPRANERGSLMAEMIVAIAILVVALFPLGYSFAKEGKLLRACYNRAVAMEIVDGETELLLAGEWRAFKEGTQIYVPHAQAATNLAPGEFQLTLKDRRLRLEWLPAGKDKGGKVVREVTVK